MDLVKRKAIIDDIDILTDIYNQAIYNKNCTCDTEPFIVEGRINWFKEHENSNYPIYTFLLDKQITGYGYFSPYRQGRNAVKDVAEISYYLDYSIHGKKIGSKILEFMLNEAEKLGFKTLIAIVMDSNRKSIKLLEKYNFDEWGRLPKMVKTDEGMVDHLYYGKHI